MAVQAYSERSRRLLKSLLQGGTAFLSLARLQSPYPARLWSCRVSCSIAPPYPAMLIGWSWGAWLACFLTAQHPSLVSKPVLIGCAPFKAGDGSNSEDTSRAAGQNRTGRNRLFPERERRRRSRLPSKCHLPHGQGRFICPDRSLRSRSPI